MKLRYFATVVVLVLTTVAAHAQTQGNVGLYFNPVAIRISNSNADSGSFAFLGQNATSNVFYGYNLGGYYDFYHSGSMSAGLDVRFRRRACRQCHAQRLSWPASAFPANQFSPSFQALSRSDFLWATLRTKPSGCHCAGQQAGLRNLRRASTTPWHTTSISASSRSDTARWSRLAQPPSALAETFRPLAPSSLTSALASSSASRRHCPAVVENIGLRRTSTPGFRQRNLSAIEICC